MLNGKESLTDTGFYPVAHVYLEFGTIWYKLIIKAWLMRYIVSIATHPKIDIKWAIVVQVDWIRFHMKEIQLKWCNLQTLRTQNLTRWSRFGLRQEDKRVEQVILLLVIMYGYTWIGVYAVDLSLSNEDNVWQLHIRGFNWVTSEFTILWDTDTVCNQ